MGFSNSQSSNSLPAPGHADSNPDGFALPRTRNLSSEHDPDWPGMYDANQEYALPEDVQTYKC